MARYPEDFDQDEIDEIEHARAYKHGKENVRFLSKRLGYRYVDWVHGCDLLDALQKYGEILEATKKLRRPRDELVAMAMEYADWLDLIEGTIAQQNPHVWRKPGEMDGAPEGVPSILAELRTSVIRKLATGSLYAIGYIETSRDPYDWPLWVANYDSHIDFYRANYDWAGSRINETYLSVRIAPNLGETMLLPEVPVPAVRRRGRPSVREDIREAFHQAVSQGAIAPGNPMTTAFKALRPLTIRNAALRGKQIDPSDETLRKHTVDLFRELNARKPAARSKAKAGPGV